jgi:phage-related holin
VVELSEFDAVLHFFKRLFDAPLAKGILAAILAIARVCLGATMRSAYTAIAVLWLADWATGTIRAWADPHDTVKSRRWYHALIKLLLYLGLLLVGHQVSRIDVIFVGTALQSVVEGSIIGTEALSVCENLDLLGKLAGVDLPIIAQIVRFLKGKQKMKLDEIEKRCETE